MPIGMGFKLFRHLEHIEDFFRLCSAMVTKLLFSISLNSFILFESVKLRKICGLRKYAGKFFCEIWAVFNRVALLSGMPHFIIRNATFDKVNAAFRECSSVAFAFSQVRRLPCRSVAFRTVKCGISFTPSPSFF